MTPERVFVCDSCRLEIVLRENNIFFGLGQVVTGNDYSLKWAVMQEILIIL